MSQEWYYIVSETPRGPITAKQLTRKAAQGRIWCSDFVWREGFPDWVQAGELQWLSMMFSAENTEATVETESIVEVAEMENDETQHEINERPDSTSRTDSEPDDDDDFYKLLSQILMGEIGLAVTFWGLGLVAVIVFFAFGFITTLLPVIFGSAETVQGALATAVCVIIWSIINAYIAVSIWMSADSPSTATHWRFLARSCVVPLGLFSIYNLAILALTAGIILFDFISGLFF